MNVTRAEVLQQLQEEMKNAGGRKRREGGKDGGKESGREGGREGHHVTYPNTPFQFGTAFLKAQNTPDL